MTTLQDIFTYFAKFPQKAGVLELFNRSASDHFPAYASLKTGISALDPHSLIPGIQDYVFGIDEQSIKKRIEEISGTYLFVDYGNIASQEDNLKRRTDEILIAITVATPLHINALDMVEQVLLADQALDYLLQIMAIMRQDSRCSPFVKQLTFPVEITPFLARELSDSTGWTMVVKKSELG
jgi:hypothetical protein